MPSSSIENVPLTMHFAWRLNPRSVLDVGAGFGKYGVLFREYLELKYAGQEGRTEVVPKKAERKVKIDGLEGFGEYINDVHRAVYDNIHVESIQSFLKKDWSYDFIYMGDVLEHLDKKEAEQTILPGLVSRAKLGLLVSVPRDVEEQSDVFGNELEIHRSKWTAGDLERVAPHSFVGRKGGHLFAFLTKDASQIEKVKPSALQKLRAVKWALVNSI